MTALLLASSFASPLVLGCALAACGCPGAPLPARYLLRLAVGAVLGSGTIAVLFFLWVLATGGPGYGFLPVEAAAALGAWIFLRRFVPIDAPPSAAVPGNDLLTWYLAIIFWSLFAGSVALHLLISLAQPHGLVDAWGMWNMRAKTMFHGGLYWTRVFGTHITSADHPLLLPGFVARAWMLVGRDIPAAPALVALVFAMATTLLLFSPVACLRGRTQGYLAGIVLLGTGISLQHAPTQYADVPLASFMLAAFGLLALYDSGSVQGPAPLVLAGLAAGLAAWTKNEGLLFCVALFAGRLVGLPGGRVRERLRDVGLLAVGALPVLCIALGVKAAFAPPNYIFAFQGVEVTAARLLDPGRHAAVAAAFLRNIWVHFGLSLLSLATYACLIGVPSRPRRVPAGGLATLVLQLTGYYVTYVISPVDLRLHLVTSVHRVLLHLWPCFLMVCFLIVRTPEEAWPRLTAIQRIPR